MCFKVRKNELISFIWKSKILIFCSLICILLEIIMDLLSPVILSNTINIGIFDNNLDYIIKNIVLMFIILIIGIFGSICSTYLSSKISNTLGYKLRGRIIEKIINLKYKEIDKLNVGHTVTLVTNDISTIENILFLLLKILIKIPILLIGSIFMCLTLNIKMSLIILILIPILIIISYIFMKRTYPYFNLTEKCIDEINSNIRENINNIKLVKSNNREIYEINKFDKINRNFKKLDTKALKILSLMMPINIFVINIATIFVLLFSKIEIEKGSFLIGDIAAFIEYINLLLSSIISVSMIILLIIQSSVSIKRINNLLKYEEEIENDGIKNRIEGDIKFKNVNFSYENSEKNILEDINITINSGDKVAIIGQTGSGKTSLVNLINRNYDISSGEILIDNINIKNYDFNYLKEIILIINQKSKLFKDTILNNLTLNKNGDINKYLKITLSDKIINKKENNLNFLIEQDGKNLSGGEKERLILCRSLIKKPDILILDDSLSAIDLKTEEKIIKNLLENYKNKTIIFITNRIRTVKNFDKIILLENGKIKQIGNHKSLLNEPAYVDLYDIGEVI